MAAAFGGGYQAKVDPRDPRANPQSKPQEAPKQYGAAGYQAQNQKGNYHYQQQQAAPQQQPPISQNQAIREQEARVKLIEEERVRKERMLEMDRKLKEKEEQLRKYDEQKAYREMQEKKRLDYEREVIKKQKREEEERKKQKQAQEEAAKRKVQDEQSRKILEAQAKRREEIEKHKAQEEVMRKKEQVRREEQKKEEYRREEKKKEEQRREEQRKVQEQAQLEEKKRQQQKLQQQQQQKQDKQNEIDWIREMTQNVHSNIMNIDQKIQAKQRQEENSGAIMSCYEPPKASKKPSSANPPKKVVNRAKWQNVEETKSKPAEIKAEPKKQQNKERQRDRVDQRKQMLKELKEKGMREKKNNGFQFEFIGVDYKEDMSQNVLRPSTPSKLDRPKLQSATPTQRGNSVDRIVKKAEPTSDASTQCYKANKSQQKMRDQSPIPPVVQQDMGQDQTFEIQYSDQMNDEQYNEKYQMCEEMMNLIKGNIKSYANEEEKDNSDNEGFNEEREDYVEEIRQQKALRSGGRQFDGTLSIVQECDEPEQTFENTHQQKSKNPTNVQDIKQEENDRDDLDDEDTDISQPSSQFKKKKKIKHKDFTFANGQDSMIDEQLSKFQSVENIREYLETELGDEKVMKVYPILREMV